MSRLQRARAVCIVVVTVFAGAPVLAATCELTCSHSSAESHHSGSHASHQQHAAAPHAHDDVRGAIEAVSERDCCRDTAATATATIAGRVDAKAFATAYSLVPAGAPFVAATQAALTAPTRGAPAGRSPASALLLPLRI